MKNQNYIKRLFIAIDQLGNALCDGEPDTTISARLHWLSTTDNSKKWGYKYFKILRRVVDYTFYPFDGAGHCYQAYYYQRHTVLRGSKTALILLGVLVFLSCILIIPIGWVHSTAKAIRSTK